MMAAPVDQQVTDLNCRAEFSGMLGGVDHRPKLVVDYDQTVLWCCEDTERMLRDPMPLCMQKGRLLVSNDDLRSEFTEFLHNLGANVERKLVRGKAQRHWVVLRAWKPDRWEGAVCILCTPSVPLRDITESGLARELKLTLAEARVLNEFAELNSPKHIAEVLGVSLSTVRSHLKTIHAKASVSSSAQLLRLAHTYCSA